MFVKVFNLLEVNTTLAVRLTLLRVFDLYLGLPC